MAARKSSNSQPSATENSMELDRLAEVLRTGRMKPATPIWPGKKTEQWREENLIAANKNADEPDH